MATWSQRGLESVEFLPIVRWRANHYHWWDSAHHPRPVPTLSTLTETMEPLSLDPIQWSRYNIFVMNETGDGVDGETGGRWQSRDQTTLHLSSPPQTSHLLTQLLQYRGLQVKCFQTMCIMKSSPSSLWSSSASSPSWTLSIIINNINISRCSLYFEDHHHHSTSTWSQSSPLHFKVPQKTTL